MAYHVTMDVPAQIETLEKKKQQEAAHQERQDDMESPQKEDKASERSVKERPWLQQFKRAKNWPIDNIRSF